MNNRCNVVSQATLHTYSLVKKSDAGMVIEVTILFMTVINDMLYYEL